MPHTGRTEDARTAMPYTHRVGRKPPCERHVTIGAPAAVSTAAASLVHQVHSARHAAHLPSLHRIVCPDSARRTGPHAHVSSRRVARVVLASRNHPHAADREPQLRACASQSLRRTALRYASKMRPVRQPVRRTSVYVLHRLCMAAWLRTPRIIDTPSAQHAARSTVRAFPATP
jgi:hypothetical protein